MAKKKWVGQDTNMSVNNPLGLGGSLSVINSNGSIGTSAFPSAYNSTSVMHQSPSLVAKTTQSYQPMIEMDNWSRNTDADTTAFVPKQEASGGFGSYLEGFTGGVKDIGKSMFDFVTPTKAADSHAQYVQDWTNGIGKTYKAAEWDPTGKIMLKPAEGTSLNEYIDQTQKQQGINNQQWATGMQAGLGAVNGIFGAMSYFDNKAMNKKNMQLVDQQIANNQDVMKTRTERAGDIKKYFG